MSRNEMGLPGWCRQAIADFQMFGRGDSLVVGVSGGADSVALFHFLRALAVEWDLSLTAVHLNHRLRGAESDRDEAFVRRLCADWGIPLTAHSAEVADLAAVRGLSVEECARRERYALFERVAAVRDARIVTAHNLDDSTETVLLNLARGTGLRGLCGIPPVRRDPGRPVIVRPLIGCSRREVETYCAAEGLPFVTDSTNLSDDYTRNKLRHRVMPVLAEVNPAVLRSVAGTTDALRADADYLDALAEQAMNRSARGGDSWDSGTLLAQPEPLRRRALLRILADHGVPVERRRLEQLEGLLTAGGAMQLSGEWFCRCSGGCMTFFPAVREERWQLEPIPLSPAAGDRNILLFSAKMLCVSWRMLGNFEETINNPKNQFQNALDCAKIGRIIKIRQRMPGDRIRLAGRGCTKTLRKLFNEAGLSSWQRERTLVLEDENGPLWVEGFGVAESAAVDAGTRHALFLETHDSPTDEFS